MTIPSISAKSAPTAFTTKPSSTSEKASGKSQATEHVKDNIDITAVAKEINEAFKSSKSTPAINEQRVQAVKDALEQGTYPINAEKIASKMIQIEREQFNNSR